MPNTVLSSAESIRKFKAANKKQTYVVLFHMSTCPHCVMMRPAWADMIKAVSGDCCTAEVEYAHLEEMPPTMRKIRGFPTIAAVSNGAIVVEYNGDRSAESLKDFALAHGKKEAPKAKAKAAPKAKAASAPAKVKAAAAKPKAKSA